MSKAFSAFSNKWGIEKVTKFNNFKSLFYQTLKELQSLTENFNILTNKYITIIQELNDGNEIKHFVRDYFTLFVWLFDKIMLFTNGKLLNDYQVDDDINKIYIHETKLEDFTNVYQGKSPQLSVLSCEGFAHHKKELISQIKDEATVSNNNLFWLQQITDTSLCMIETGPDVQKCA